ncbi:hypothetical protein [Streptomyces gardneri]|uniref:hypothetical protein n=1 Tax=Streptomyces gardneri TaxID=66892 RepID=UPI0035E1370E
MADDTELPDFDVPVGLFQDVEDLKAEVARLTAQAKGLAEADAAGAGEASAGDDRRPADRAKTARKETNGSSRRSSCCSTPRSTATNCAP